MANSTSDVQKVYIGIFGRPADPSGLAYWSNQNVSLTDIGNNFVVSSDLAGMSTMQKINTMYNNLLGHDADWGGLVYWTNQVNNGQITIGGVMASMIIGASAADQPTISNKVYAASVFDAHIDTTAESIAYMYGNNTATVAQIAKTWLAQVRDYQTVDSAIRSVDTTLLNIVKAAGLGLVASKAAGAEAFVGPVQHEAVNEISAIAHHGEQISLIGVAHATPLGGIANEWVM